MPDTPETSRPLDTPTTELRSVAVFCGSSPGRSPEHIALAKAVGASIAEQGLRLVYGGGGLGLMGATASAARDGGAPVLGVIPEVLREVEATLSGIDHEFVPDMHVRKIRMYAESDGFIILPGGIGTLEEAIEVLSWQQLNLHNKPIVFVSDTGYWDLLLQELDRLIGEGFARASMAGDVLVATSVEEALDKAEAFIADPPARVPLGLRDVSVENFA